MDSSGSRDNPDVMPLLDSGGAGDELDDMMSEDEIDSELKKIATGQNHFLLLFFCFPMFTKPTRSEPSCAPPHGMVWTAGLPPYVMVWAVGLSLYGMVWTARFSLLWYGLGCRAFYRFVCLVNASTCFPKMSTHVISNIFVYCRPMQAEDVFWKEVFPMSSQSSNVIKDLN